MKVRLRLGDKEVEVEGSKEEVAEFFSQVPDIISKLRDSKENIALYDKKEQDQQQIPSIAFGKNESLPSIILKLFSSGWGKQTRKLIEVKDMLETFGLIYPKQSVAVALLRLAKEGKLRRFKQADGEFVYTLPSTLITPEIKAEALQVSGSAES